MSKSRLLLSIASVFASAALIVGATIAFFSDTETSAGNLLEAGKIDLKIDNESYYNGVLNAGTTWITPSDLTDQLFFNFTDIKPNDFGEDTISVHVDDNPCWICAEVKLTSSLDNSSTDPELGDETPYTPDVGELAAKINFLWWADDGDNVLEVGETSLPVGGPIGALGVGNTATIALADSTTDIWATPSASPSPFPGNVTKYIGKAWCFGNISALPLTQDNVGDVRNPSLDNNLDLVVNSKDGGFACDGSLENNSTQTDSLTLDVTFKAIQARNNPNFVCSQSSPSPTPSGSPSPTPGPCTKPDFMLVLDRSGSINSTELGQLKTAAKAFVDALNPSTPNAHVGFSSFSTTATLNQHLSDNGTTVKNAIDLLTSSGLTNLQGGINLANTELGGGDGHDRTDLTSPDYIVIITDGNPNEPGSDTNARNVAAAAATAAKAAGTKIYVVGVGGDVDASYLQNQIASPGSYFPIANYSNLATVLTSIANCPQ